MIVPISTVILLRVSCTPNERELVSEVVGDRATPKQKAVRVLHVLGATPRGRSCNLKKGGSGGIFFKRGGGGGSNHLLRSNLY